MGKRSWTAKVCLPGLFAIAAAVMTAAAPVQAGTCSSAHSAIVFEPLEPAESPLGYQTTSHHCYSGVTRGSLKGTLIICLSESDMLMDDNVCACGSGEPLWNSEGEGGAMVYRSKAWFSNRRGSFQAIERGTQVENTGYPDFPYPDDRFYWAGIMQILPDSGTGDFADMVYGTILIHNEWNNPAKANLLGEVCVP